MDTGQCQAGVETMRENGLSDEEGQEGAVWWAAAQIES